MFIQYGKRCDTRTLLVKPHVVTAGSVALPRAEGEVTAMVQWHREHR